MSTLEKFLNHFELPFTALKFTGDKQELYKRPIIDLIRFMAEANDKPLLCLPIEESYDLLFIGPLKEKLFSEIIRWAYVHNLSYEIAESEFYIREYDRKTIPQCEFLNKVLCTLDISLNQNERIWLASHNYTNDGVYTSIWVYYNWTRVKGIIQWICPDNRFPHIEDISIDER